MKKLTFSIATIALVGLYAGVASAACDFDIVKGKGIKGSFVRAYAACPSTQHPASNTETEGGTEGCEPVQPVETVFGATTFKFADNGGCTGSTQAKLVPECGDLEDAAGNPLGLQTGPCHVTFVKSKCKGIVLADGVTPIGSTNDGWAFGTLSRTTLADDTNGDMTIIDFPVTFLYDEPNNGSIKLKSDSAQALAPLVGVNNADLPDCTQIEIVDIIIKDPASRPFARLGGATVPD